MRRYSEIPNTPTPFSKTNNDLKIGSIITIPNTGRAVLRYIGPVQGKSGRFAGIELVGDNAVLGKNSGDVNGVEYFKTKQPGAGLFMAYDKLLSTLDYIESPVNKRLSLMHSPSESYGPTPSRKHMSATPSTLSHTRSLSKRSSIARSHSSTPPLQKKVDTKSSPSYEELKRLENANTMIENEKNNLINETQSLRYEIDELKSRLEHHDKLAQDLELKHSSDQLKLEKSNERIETIEAKLRKQKRSHEEQREELLSVIDQLEAQVSDNEQLYIGELQKLQEEIRQKEEALTHFKSSETTEKSIETDRNMKSQIEQLMLEKQELDSVITELKKDIEVSEKKISQLNKESLQLKEAIISDQKRHEVEIAENKGKIAKLDEDHEIKDRVIEKLRDEIKSLQAHIETISQTQNVDELQKDIADLKEQLKGKDALAHENLALKDQLKSLQKQAEIRSDVDKINELEFKLENKERIIQDLKFQVAETRDLVTNSGGDDRGAEAVSVQLTKLKEEIQAKDRIIEQNKDTSEVLNSVRAEAEALKKELEAKQRELNDKGSAASQMKDLESAKAINASRLESKEKELQSLRETMLDLQAQLKELKLVDQKKSVIESERAELDKRFKLKEAEILTLNEKIEELTTKNLANVDTNYDTIIEEKNIEIELLKEELLASKSNNEAHQATELKKELDELKKLNNASTNAELNKQIQLLQAELKQRPSAAECEELRSELELIDELRKLESKDKDKEIDKLQKLLAESTRMLHESSRRLTDSGKKEKFKPSQIYTDDDSKEANRATMSSLSLNRPPVISQVVDGALQIYVPESKDPTNGRKLWCGLCEREGHDSIDCPYENDVF